MEIRKTNQEITIAKPIDHVLAQAPAFRDEKIEVFTIVQAAVAKAYADLNFKVPEQKDKEYIINELTDNIRKNYRTIRTKEIPVAFAKGVRGEYGEFMGLSIVTFEKFIQGYINSPYREELGKSLPLLSPPAREKVLTRQDRIDFAKAAFDKFKFHDFYNDLGNIVYNFLDSEGMIPFTSKEKFEVMNLVREREYKRLSSPITRQEKRDFEKHINKLVESNDPIIPSAKRECLNRFFAKLKAEGKELEFSDETTDR